MFELTFLVFSVYDSERVDGLVDFRLGSGRVVSFSVFRTSFESGRLSCYIHIKIPNINVKITVKNINKCGH